MFINRYTNLNALSHNDLLSCLDSMWQELASHTNLKSAVGEKTSGETDPGMLQAFLIGKHC